MSLSTVKIVKFLWQLEFQSQSASRPIYTIRMADQDYSAMKIADLKKELKAKGLPVSGKKEELVERLQNHNESGADLLDEEDDLLTDESIKKAEAELKAQEVKAPRKKIAIKRDVPIPAVMEEEDKPDEPVVVEKEKEIVAVEEAVIKHSKVTGPESDDTKENAAEDKNGEKLPVSPTGGMTAEERIKARAERFGGFQSDDAKKNARAARFGDQLNGGVKGGGKIGGAPAADLDTLKKRAERFGVSSSSVMKKAELSDAIKKRQERFGVVSGEPKPKKIALNIGVNSVVMDEKMQKRKERFGI